MATTAVLDLSKSLAALAIVKTANDASSNHLRDAKDYIILAISKLNPDFLSPFDWSYLHNLGFVADDNPDFRRCVGKALANTPCWLNSKKSIDGTPAGVLVR